MSDATTTADPGTATTAAATTAAAATTTAAGATTATPAGAAAALGATDDASTTAAATTTAPPGLTLPGKDATPADWGAYYKAISAPDAAALAAELPVPEGTDKAFATEAATQMAEVGLLPHQAQKLAEWWNTKSAAAQEAFKTEQTRVGNEAAAAAEAKVNAEDAALRNEWTPAKYDANMEVAKRAVRQFLPADKAAATLTALEQSIGYGATMRLMHKIGAGLGEGTLKGDGHPGESAVKSIAERLYGNTPAN